MNDTYTIGIDFGTDSVRAVVVNTANGNIAGTAISHYPRWKEGKFCDPSRSQFRQHPKDYLESLEEAVKGALAGMDTDSRKAVVGISIDTTGSTVVAVDEQGTPLSMLPEFADNPHAMFILWKDHTATKEAEEVNSTARSFGTDYTQYVGGIYSAEWFWAKILKTYREDARVREKAFSWMEHCDWISAALTGNTDPLAIRRSRCAAGHKAMWHEAYNGLPPEEFFIAIDPLLEGLRGRLFENTYTSDQAMGTLSEEWASKLGLLPSVVVGVGAFDCHMGAVGAQITPYAFVRVMGTSTCDILIAPNEEMDGALIKGICGQVDGSVIPGYLGMEAGQSAYGDYYAWFQRLVTGPVRAILGEAAADEMDAKVLQYVSEEAFKLRVTEADAVALDWVNGRRTPDANHSLKAAFSGIHLGTDAIKLFKAIVEATSFGSKAIVDRFISEGVPIKEVIAIGGVAKKSPFVMQNLSDVLNVPIKVATADQACALGAAMFAAVAAGVYPRVEVAQERMGSGFDETYTPRAEYVATYQKLYEKYQKLGNFIETNV